MVVVVVEEVVVEVVVELELVIMGIEMVVKVVVDELVVEEEELVVITSSDCSRHPLHKNKIPIAINTPNFLTFIWKILLYFLGSYLGSLSANAHSFSS